MLCSVVCYASGSPVESSEIEGIREGSYVISRARNKSFIKGIREREQLAHEMGANLVTWVPKAIAVTSRLPFLGTFRAWLAQLYAWSLSASSGMPMERWISFFVLRCPVPRPGGPAISFKFHLHMPSIKLRLPKLQVISSFTPTPSASCLALACISQSWPLLDLSFETLFRSLAVPQVLTAFTVLVLERKLVLSSRRAHVVTEVCEALLALLFPLQWEGAYIPRLADAFFDCLEAPGGCLLGVEDLTEPPEDRRHLGSSGNRRKTLLERILEVSVGAAALGSSIRKAELTGKEHLAVQIPVIAVIVVGLDSWVSFHSVRRFILIRSVTLHALPSFVVLSERHHLHRPRHSHHPMAHGPGY